MCTLYCLLFNTVYIKNSPTCFEPCHSLSSGTQLFITPAIYVWYSLKYLSWFDKMPLSVLSFIKPTYIYINEYHTYIAGVINNSVPEDEL